MERRADWVDYAKAIGIILVVYGHVARGLYNAGIEIPTVFYQMADSIIYSFHMPLFFFLSGLFFYSSLSKRGQHKLVLNKIDTILYPYIIWSILQGSIEATLSNYTNGDVSFGRVFTLWEPRAQFWFLFALFFIFIFSTAISNFLKENHVTIALLSSALLYFFPIPSPGTPIFSYISQYLVFFFFGAYFEKNLKQIILQKGNYLLISALVFITAQWLFHDYLSLTYKHKGITSLILALISITFIAILASHINQRNIKFISFIGTSSMGIYLMHIIASSGGRIVISKIFHTNDYIIHLITGCALGIAAPIFAILIIKRLKIPFLFSAPISTLFTRTTLQNNSLKKKPKKQ